MIYVARHGETVWNEAGLVCGRADVPLTDKGRKQAILLGEEVAAKGDKITKIIHSPLQRAKLTAQAVADKNGLPMVSDPRLMEMDFGLYDGISGHAPEFRMARREFSVRFPEGESFMDMYARVIPVVEECLADQKNTYLLVCHNAVIRMIHSYFKPLPKEVFFDFAVDNAKLIEYKNPFSLPEKNKITVI